MFVTAAVFLCVLYHFPVVFSTLLLFVRSFSLQLLETILVCNFVVSVLFLSSYWKRFWCVILLFLFFFSPATGNDSGA